MHEAMWSRVEAQLDARRSPFDDPELAAELHADPASERAARRLLAGLARISLSRQTVSRQAVSRQTTIPLRSRVLGVAAGLLLTAGAALVWRAWDDDPACEQLAFAPTLSIVVQHSNPPPARGARVELGPQRVLAWTLAGEAP